MDNHLNDLERAGLERCHRLAELLADKGISAFAGPSWDGYLGHAGPPLFWYFSPRSNGGVNAHVQYDGTTYDNGFLDPDRLDAAMEGLAALPEQPSRAAVWAALAEAEVRHTTGGSWTSAINMAFQSATAPSEVALAKFMGRVADALAQEDVDRAEREQEEDADQAEREAVAAEAGTCCDDPTPAVDDGSVGEAEDDPPGITEATTLLYYCESCSRDLTFETYTALTADLANTRTRIARIRAERRGD